MKNLGALFVIVAFSFPAGADTSLDVALSSSVQRINAQSATGGASFSSDGFNPGVTVRARTSVGGGFDVYAKAGISRLGFNTPANADTLVTASTARWQLGVGAERALGSRVRVHVEGLVDKRAFAWRPSRQVVAMDLLTVPQLGGGAAVDVVQGEWGLVRAGVEAGFLTGVSTGNYRVSGGWLARASVAYAGVVEDVPGSLEAYVLRARQDTSLYAGELEEMGLMLVVNFNLL